MGVKEKGEKYRCNVCGNEVKVTYVGGGNLLCCERPMEMIKEGTPEEEEEEEEEEEKNEEETWGEFKDYKGDEAKEGEVEADMNKGFAG
jgi:desulfoferrodoxin-like iron-binding protein